MSVIKTEEPNLTTPNSFDSKVFELMKQVNRLQKDYRIKETEQIIHTQRKK